MLAFSDFYNTLNLILGNDIYSCKEDYIEQSEGFRQFLHRFCEIALGEGHKFEVPFQYGSFYDIEEFSSALDFVSFGGMHRKKRFHPDIVIFSNFLTNEGIVEKYKAQLSEIAKSMKNHGLIIVVSLKQTGRKYKRAFDSYNQIFLRPNIYGIHNIICLLKIIHRYLIYRKALLNPYCFHSEFISRFNIIVYSVANHNSIFGRTVCTAYTAEIFILDMSGCASRLALCEA